MSGITNITLTDSGFGYATAPTITISLPGGDSASATAVATLNFEGTQVLSISLTDSGYYYTNTPTVTIDLPTTAIQSAAATVNLDSATASLPLSISSLSLSNAGSYYLIEPEVILNFTQSPPTTWETSAAKYGTYSYRLNQNYNDSDYTNFSNKDSAGADVKYDHILEFWVKTPSDTLVGDILKFPQINDTSGELNQIEINGQNLVYRWSEASGVSGSNIQSSADELTPEIWHFVQILRDFDGSAVDVKMYIDGAVADYVDNRPTNIDNLIQSTVRFVNDSSVDGVMFDAIRLTKNDSPIFQPDNIPDSDRNPYNPVLSDSNENYLGFELLTPVALATLADNVVSGFTITNKGNYLSGVTATLDSPSGGPSDFRATALATVDSGNGGRISSITIVDSGDFYLTTPNVTIDSATGTAADYRATATATLNDSGAISSITITDSGGGYVTAPTVTIANPAYTNVRKGDKATQTLSSGVTINGEIVKYSDSDGILYLAHVGASDGKYHTYVSGRDISFGRFSALDPITYTRKVLSVTEDNTLSNNEQNDNFGDFVDDFLDFTEDNPFGEPS